jgi:hypothetical protein
VILKHPVTGHEVRTDDESAEFWRGAGYRAPAKPPVKKAAAKKAPAKPDKK